MSNELFITLKSMEHRKDSRVWTVEFSARSTFIGHSTFQVTVEDSDPDPRGDDIPRSPEDVIARARRRLAVGLGKLAKISLEAVDAEFKNAVTTEVLSAGAQDEKQSRPDDASESLSE